MRQFASGAYRKEHARALADPAAFWQEKAKQLEWFQPPPAAATITRDANGINRWFKGGSINAAYLAVDVHAKQRPQQTALIHDSPVTGSVTRMNYAQLHEQVAAVAYAPCVFFSCIFLCFVRCRRLHPGPINFFCWNT